MHHPNIIKNQSVAYLLSATTHVEWMIFLLSRDSFLSNLDLYGCHHCLFDPWSSFYRSTTFPFTIIHHLYNMYIYVSARFSISEWSQIHAVYLRVDLSRRQSRGDNDVPTIYLQ
eukprot:186439_1